MPRFMAPWQGKGRRHRVQHGVAHGVGDGVDWLAVGGLMPFVPVVGEQLEILSH